MKPSDVPGNVCMTLSLEQPRECLPSLRNLPPSAEDFRASGLMGDHTVSQIPNGRLCPFTQMAGISALLGPVDSVQLSGLG